MVHYCVAYKCTKKYSKGGVGFFRFPLNKPVLLDLWIQAMGRKDWFPTTSSRICGNHFQTGRPSKDSDHPDYIPNVFPFKKQKISVQSYERRKNLKEKLEKIEAMRDRESTSVNMDSSNLLVEVMGDSESTSGSMDTSNLLVEVMGDSESTSGTLDTSNIFRVKIENVYSTPGNSSEEELRKQLESLNLEIQMLRNEKSKLKEKLEHNSWENIVKDHGKLNFYTGLSSSELFYWLLDIMDEEIPETIQVLTRSEQLLIALMKLKLNLLSTDLAYRFNTSRKTVGRILDLWLPTLAQKMKALIKYPSAKALKLTLSPVH